MQTPRSARRWLALTTSSALLMTLGPGCGGGGDKTDGAQVKVSDEVLKQKDDMIKKMREEAIAKAKKGGRR